MIVEFEKITGEELSKKALWRGSYFRAFFNELFF
jgi:hypothetical protein